MGQTLGYLLTWTTYGTWLPGDRRGWVSKTNAAPGAEYDRPIPALMDLSQRQMKHEEVVLSQYHRDIVEQAIAEVCRNRGWTLYASNCRSNHIHAVADLADVSAKKGMSDFKAYATRALRDAGFFLARRIWTRGGSARHIHTEESLSAAISYVVHQ